MYQRILVFGLLFLAVLGIVGGASAQSTPITYLRYDVDVQLNADGTFNVREIQQIRFDDRFHTAFAEIPRQYTTAIDRIQVWEEEKAYTRDGTGPGSFTVDDAGDPIVVEWEYAYTEPGEVRTFILEYRVAGGLWVYPNEDLLEWRAVPADRSGISVEASRVTVELPAPVADGDLRYTAFGPPFQATAQGQRVIFEADGPIPDGVHFQVQVGFPHGLVAAEPQAWQRAEDEARLVYRFEALETDLTIRPDGSLEVEERHRVTVDAGAMASGNRRFILDTLDAVADIAVWEGDQPFSPAAQPCEYCFTLSERGRAPDWVQAGPRGVTVDRSRAGLVALDWYFPALVKGESTTFRLRYRVEGALQVADQSQRLTWAAVFADRAVPVESAAIRIHLPPGLAATDVTVEGGAPRVEPDGSLVLSHDEPVPPNQSWQVHLTLPPGATGASPPRWQRDHEAVLEAYQQALEAARQAQVRRARWQLGLGAGSLLLLVGGLFAVLLVWYRWGRDYPVPPAAEYLSEPPSTLPPAIVAYLVDERPSPKGALAALFHLATLGLLRIDLAAPLSLTRTHEEALVEGQSPATAGGETVTVPGHLATLFNALRPALPVGAAVPLSRIYAAFQQVLPSVYAEMGEEAARYFSDLPTQSRHRWLVAGQWIVLVGIAALVFSLVQFSAALGLVAAALPAALVVVGLALTIVSRWMAQKSTLGAEEASRWLAFKRYLVDLKRFGTLDQAQRVLDRYFAYAVALDVEKVVLAQAEAVGAAVPVWAGSYSPARRTRIERGWDREPAAAPELGTATTTPAGASEKAPATRASQADVPADRSLQGLSDGLARSLDNASNSLASLLNTAAGRPDEETPFNLVLKGTGKATEISIDAAATTLDILGAILEASASGGGGGYSSRSSHRGGSSRRSRSSSSSFRRSSSSGRSSGSRRSGGGGRRGFG